MVASLTRRAVIALACATALLSTPALAQQAGAPVDIRMVVGDTVISGQIIDNATSRSLLEKLPLTVPMVRHGDREYYGRLPEPLSTEGPKQEGFANGDIGYWAPGGYFAVFLDNTLDPDISNLIVVGSVTSELSAFNNLGQQIEMRIECAGAE